MICPLTRTVKTILFPEKGAAKILIFFLFFQLLSFSLFAQQRLEPLPTEPPILSTQITLSLRKVTIQKLLDTLSTNKDIKFSYVNYELPLQTTIDINVQDTPLKTILDSVLYNQGIQYIVVSKQIVLKKIKKTSSYNDSFSKSNFVNRLSIGLFGGGGICYRRLHEKHAGGLATRVVRNDIEHPRLNFAGGIHLTYQYSAHLSFRSGATILNMGEKGASTYVLSTDSILSSTTTTNNGNGSSNANSNANKGNPTTDTQIQMISSIYAGEASYKTNYNFLMIPLMVGYTIGKAPWLVSMYTGGSVGFLVGHSTSLRGNSDYYETVTALTNYPLNKFVFALPVIMELEWRLNTHWSAVGACSFYYFTSSLYTSLQLVSERPYSVNTTLGIAYRISK